MSVRSVLLIGAFLSGYGTWVPGLTLFGLYLIGLVLAPLVAFALKRTLLRGEAPIFVMEMPLYKMPSWRIVARRAFDGGWMFVRRAGTLILASMVVIWALLYFPSTDAQGRSYEDRLVLAEELADFEQQAEANPHDMMLIRAIADLRERVGEPSDANAIQSEWKSRSLLGRAGKLIEPAVEPLGWDWRIGLSALASFPAREVMVGTLGIVFSQGEGKSDDEDFRARIGTTLHEAFTLPVALSVMVFFALCCQCASTLAVIKRETNSWLWPAFTFTYMTALAYLGALVTYQVGRLFG